MVEESLIEVGEIIGVFGVKGWVKIFSLTDVRENILNYSPWILSNGIEQRIVNLENGKRQGKSVIALIENVTDRDQAAFFVGWKILIKKSQLPSLNKDEYYWIDLVGLNVLTEQGILLGKVDHLLETGANDVLVVQHDGIERLIPFIQKQVIKKIDLDQQQMVVDWDPEF